MLPPARKAYRPARGVTRPFLSEKRFLRLRSLHLRQFTHSALARSHTGQLQASVQDTVSQTPSLYYYLLQQCGIGFTEADAMVKQRRLFAGGKPLEGLEALKVQFPLTQLPNLELEVARVGDGKRVPADERDAHRFYGMLHVGRDVVCAHSELDPRSYIHLLRRLKQPAPSAAGEGSGSLSGLDDGSHAALLSLPGVVRTSRLRGLALITNDTTAAATWAPEGLGVDGTIDIYFQPGTPTEVIASAEGKLKEMVHAAPVATDAEALIQRSVQRTESLAASDASAPVYPVLRVETPVLRRSVFSAIQRGAAPALWQVSRVGPFHLSDADLAPNTARSLSAEERRMFQDYTKRQSVQRIIAGLRELD